jgi:archaemetzincin
MTRIQLIPVGSVDLAILEWLTLALKDNLSSSVAVHPGVVDPSDTYHPARQQYNSTALLAKLLQLARQPEEKILGVADVDLFIPILTFVYGEAQLNNRAAVVSVYRLRQEFYGLPGNDPLFYQRCEKEALHELGHTFGLVHCKQFDCLMHFSNSIEQIDLKSNSFCPACTSTLALSLQRTPSMRE